MAELEIHISDSLMQVLVSAYQMAGYEMPLPKALQIRIL